MGVFETVTVVDELTERSFKAKIKLKLAQTNSIAVLCFRSSLQNKANAAE